MLSMNSLPQNYRAIVFGSSGGIGAAFVKHLQGDPNCSEVVGLSRFTNPKIDFSNEETIASAAQAMTGEFNILIDATGFLSDEETKPEKSLRALNADNLMKLYQLNAIGPALLMKYFSKLMPKDERSIFATLSARVGSIGDNQLGGWYAYRAAKSAQNMLLKCTAIEVGRTKPDAVFVSLHPGTVETPLSDPFAGSRERLTPDRSTEMMLGVMDGLSDTDTGSFWDYKGERVEW
jgi:NAD(P)-dependent dehydrogenase (short-subunit alcohol dehydrogenase family)